MDLQPSRGGAGEGPPRRSLERRGLLESLFGFRAQEIAERVFGESHQHSAEITTRQRADATFGQSFEDETGAGRVVEQEVLEERVDEERKLAAVSSAQRLERGHGAAAALNQALGEPLDGRHQQEVELLAGVQLHALCAPDAVRGVGLFGDLSFDVVEDALHGRRRVSFPVRRERVASRLEDRHRAGEIAQMRKRIALRGQHPRAAEWIIIPAHGQHLVVQTDGLLEVVERVRERLAAPEVKR